MPLAWRESWQTWRFALGVGVSSVFAGARRNGLKQVLMPVGYWRFPIFGLTVEAFADRPAGSRILDIGSPKLLSLYLALIKGFAVSATDLQDPAIEQRYRKHYQDYRFTRHPLGAYQVEFQDGRNLSYAEASFDCVYSLSVIEHIPDQGDSACCAEIARVLRPGGTAVIEVPFAREARDTYVEHSVYGSDAAQGPVFYQRHYDPATIRERLIRPSGLTLKRAYLGGERFAFGDRWQTLPLLLRTPLLWTEPLLSRCNHVGADAGDAFEVIPGRGSMNATLVLEKTGQPPTEKP